MQTFHKKVHFWGRLTIFIAFILSLSIPIYLTFIKGYIPKVEDVITGLISIAGFVGIVWIIEPISYFPTLGSAGVYMSFLSGNIGNMRMPVITATQDALDLEMGTDKSEIAGIFALVGSIFTNLLILTIVMIAGQLIISSLPESILASFNYALPGILGAMLVMMGSKLKLKHLVGLIVIGFIIMLLIKISPSLLPDNIVRLITIGDVGIVAICGIVYALIMAKKSRDLKVKNEY